jgi:hypothetical protein
LSSPLHQNLSNHPIVKKDAAEGKSLVCRMYHQLFLRQKLVGCWWWLTPVILATQEAEIGGLWFEDRLGK